MNLQLSTSSSFSSSSSSSSSSCPSSSYSINSSDLLSHRISHSPLALRLSYETPLDLIEGSGAYLIDRSGERYLDFYNNINHIGHSHPAIRDAAYQQLSILNTNTRYIDQIHEEAIKRLLSTFPSPLSSVIFVNSGSEANDLALRMAAAYTKGTEIICIEQAYHGNTISTIDISPYKFSNGISSNPHVHVASIPDTYRGEYSNDDPQAGQKYAQYVAEKIKNIERADKRLSCYISESIYGCAGQIVPPSNYFRDVYQLVHAAGGVCIADEVQCGFGRVGSCWWGFQLDGNDVIPDIVTLGKSMGNGYPVAAVVTTRAISEAFSSTGMEYFNSYGGSTLSSKIVVTVLKVIEEEKLMEKALRIGNYLKQSLNLLSEEFDSIGEIRGAGLFIGIELVNNKLDKLPAPELAMYIVNRMRNLSYLEINYGNTQNSLYDINMNINPVKVLGLRGVLLGTDGLYGNVIKIKPPLAIMEYDVDFMIKHLRILLKEWKYKNLNEKPLV